MYNNQAIKLTFFLNPSLIMAMNSQLCSEDTTRY